MTLDYSVPGQVSISMSHYVEKRVKEFPQENVKGATVASLWNENLFMVSQIKEDHEGTSAIPESKVHLVFPCKHDGHHKAASSRWSPNF